MRFQIMNRHAFRAQLDDMAMLVKVNQTAEPNVPEALSVRPELGTIQSHRVLQGPTIRSLVDNQLRPVW